MQGMSAYDPEQEIASQPPEVPKKPSVIPKALGIIHIVIAALGLFSFFQTMVTDSTPSEIVSAQFAAIPEVTISDETLAAIAAIDTPSTVIGYLDLLSSLLLLAGGIGLVRYMAWGRLVSNIYVATSLTIKSVNVYVISVIAAPFFEGLVSENPAFEEVGASALKAAVVFTIVLGSFYAFITLFLVNKKRVKASLN